MAKDVLINGVTYQGTPSVKIPLASGGGNAVFYETSGATATSAQILSGYKAYVAGGEITGNATVPSVSQDGSTKVLTIS